MLLAQPTSSFSSGTQEVRHWLLLQFLSIEHLASGSHWDSLPLPQQPNVRGKTQLLQQQLLMNACIL